MLYETTRNLKPGAKDLTTYSQAMNRNPQKISMLIISRIPRVFKGRDVDETITFLGFNQPL